MRVTKVLFGAAFAGAAVLAAPTIAQACLVPGTSASLTMTGPGGGAADAYNSVGMYGPVGSYVSVAGQGWEKGAAVQFSWGTTVPGAAELLTLPDTDSSFHVTVRVPTGAPGEIYLISASQPGAQNAALRTGTGHPFMITNPDGSLPSSTSKASSPSGTTSVAGSGRLPTAPTAPAAPEAQAANPAQASTPAAAGAASTVVIPSGPATSAAPAPVPGHAPAPRSTESPAARSAAATAVQAPAPATADAAAPPAAAPSLRTVTGELWSGFSADGQRGTSLVTVSGSTASTQGPSPSELGVGLLGVGIVALFGGFGVAEFRRRRVAVGSAS